MTDVIETTDEITTDEAVETTTEQPDPEAIAKEWLKAQGIDPDAFDPKKVASLTEWERNLNKKSSELGSMAKVIEQSAPVAPAADEPDFDEADLKNLKAALRKMGFDIDEMATAAKTARQAVVEQVDEIAIEFFESHTDVTKDEVVKHMLDDGVDLAGLTPARLKRELNKAYKAIKVEKTDIDAIVAQRLKEELAKVAGDGEQVVAVKKGRANAAGGHRTIDDIMNDPNLSSFEKMDLVAQL